MFLLHGQRIIWAHLTHCTKSLLENIQRAESGEALSSRLPPRTQACVPPRPSPGLRRPACSVDITGKGSFVAHRSTHTDLARKVRGLRAHSACRTPDSTIPLSPFPSTDSGQALARKGVIKRETGGHPRTPCRGAEPLCTPRFGIFRRSSRLSVQSHRRGMVEGFHGY